MLILARETGQRIFIDQVRQRPGIRNLWNLLSRGAPQRVATIVVKEIQLGPPRFNMGSQRGQVRIGIEADPTRYLVNREEVAARIEREGPRRKTPSSIGRKPQNSATAFTRSMIRWFFRRPTLRLQYVLPL